MRHWASAVSTSVVVAALGIAGSAGAQPFPIVGVDFDNGEGSPSNWNTVNVGTPVTLNNLVREDGAATGWSFTLDAGSPFTTAAGAATVPSHPNPLDLIGDYYFGTGTGTARFSNLTPGAQYDVWVFGLRGFTMNNRITIEGGGAPITFDQVGTAGQLFVNDAMGDPALTLADFAVQQTADANGEIRFSFEIVPGGTTGWTIAGVGIIPAPGALALLGLAGLLGGTRRSRA